MDAETGKTLDMLAQQLGTGDSRSAAIRAALAEVDRLTKRLDDAVEYGNEAAIDAMERHNRMNAEYAAHRDDANRLRAEVDALTQQVATLNRDRALMHADRIIDAATIADLEARAIPKAWVDNARTLTLEIEHHDFTGRRIQYFKPRGAELCSVTDVGDHHEPIDFPTLSAALSAAKEAP